MRTPRVTLLQAFAAGILGIAVLLAALLALVLAVSKRSILQSAEGLRAAAAMRIEALVAEELAGAVRAVSDVEQEVRLGAVQPEDRAALESALFAELLRNPHLAEATFTRAARAGFDEQGEAVFAGAPRWQVSLLREEGGRILTRLTRAAGAGFEVDLRERPPQGGLFSSALRPSGKAPDPTAHLTFRTPSSRALDGVPVWTDLSYAEADAGLPPAQRRVVVTVQKSIDDAQGRFVGVVRAGLVTEGIDAVSRLRVDDRAKEDPHRIFLADSSGRLVTRASPGDPLAIVDDSLRVAPRQLPPDLAAALASPLLREAAEGGVERSGELIVRGEPHLATFRPLPGTQDWLVGIVVPEGAYTSGLRALRMRFLAAALAVAALALAGGGAAVIALRRSLGKLLAATGRMRGLDFAPAPAEAPFRDVQQVVEGLERAKTALRALGKYAPIDLVRQLYNANREPTLGGELRELTILFTDLEGFTGLSERLSPDELARALGAYFQTMARAIGGQAGTIDKFIGDAVMAFWNAPVERADHARLACAAVLACRQVTRELYASPEWRAPPLRTRFGLHRGEAMVGHFGAPERLGYTAMGDAVNLASRLEGLCKQYGVDALVSEAVEERARDAFSFRLVDRVAVKGRKQGVRVYELLGTASEALPAAAGEYQAAFAAYEQRDFAGAAARLELHPEDGPSRVLLERCRALLALPPPPGWDGVHVAPAK